MTAAMQIALTNRGDLRAVARQDGFWTLGDFGVRMALNGLTTLATLDRYLPGWDHTHTWQGKSHSPQNSEPGPPIAGKNVA